MSISGDLGNEVTELQTQTNDVPWSFLCFFVSLERVVEFPYLISDSFLVIPVFVRTKNKLVDLSFGVTPTQSLIHDMKLFSVITDDDHVSGNPCASGGIKGSLAGNRLFALFRAAALEMT